MDKVTFSDCVITEARYSIVNFSNEYLYFGLGKKYVRVGEEELQKLPATSLTKRDYLLNVIKIITALCSFGVLPMLACIIKLAGYCTHHYTIRQAPINQAPEQIPLSSSATIELITSPETSQTNQQSPLSQNNQSWFSSSFGIISDRAEELEPEKIISQYLKTIGKEESSVEGIAKKAKAVAITMENILKNPPSSLTKDEIASCRKMCTDMIKDINKIQKSFSMMPEITPSQKEMNDLLQLQRGRIYQVEMALSKLEIVMPEQQSRKFFKIPHPTTTCHVATALCALSSCEAVVEEIVNTCFKADERELFRIELAKVLTILTEGTRAITDKEYDKFLDAFQMECDRIREAQRVERGQKNKEMPPRIDIRKERDATEDLSMFLEYMKGTEGDKVNPQVALTLSKEEVFEDYEVLNDGKPVITIKDSTASKEEITAALDHFIDPFREVLNRLVDPSKEKLKMKIKQPHFNNDKIEVTNRQSLANQLEPELSGGSKATLAIHLPRLLEFETETEENVNKGDRIAHSLRSETYNFTGVPAKDPQTNKPFASLNQVLQSTWFGPKELESLPGLFLIHPKDSNHYYLVKAKPKIVHRVEKAPNTLMLYYKRQESDPNNPEISTKISDPISAPQTLSLTEKSGEKVEYQLQSVTYHKGTVDGGHYIALQWDGSKKQWLENDDMNGVRLLSSEPILIPGSTEVTSEAQRYIDQGYSFNYVRVPKEPKPA